MQKNSLKLIPIIFLVLLIVPTAQAGIIDWWCDNIGWFCEGEPEEIVASNGLVFKPETNGVITINNERYIAFGLRGTINGVNYSYTSMDYNWTWETSGEGSDIVLSAYNNDPQIVWEQYYYFYESEAQPIKVKHYLKNNLSQDITNTQMFYLMTVDGTDFVEYNNTNYLMSNVMPLNIKGNLTDTDAALYFGTNYGFHFNDLIRTGFEINQFYAGDANFLGYPGLDIVAIGFTKNNGLFPAGAEVWIDPEFGTSDEEAIHITPWTDSNFTIAACLEGAGVNNVYGYEVNGTLNYPGTFVGSAANCDFGQIASVAYLNESRFVAGSADTSSANIKYTMFHWNFTVIGTIGGIAVDPNSGGTAGLGVYLETLNETSFVIAWIDDNAQDAEFAIYGDNYNQLMNGINRTVDTTVGGASAGISVGAFNETTFVITWQDDDSPGNIEAQVWTSGDTNTTDVIQVGVTGANGVAGPVTILNETTWVASWHDDTNSSIDFRIYNVDGTPITGIIEADSAVGAGNLKMPGIDAINTTAFAMAWYDEADTDFELAVYDNTGTALVSPTVFEPNPSTSLPWPVAVGSYEFNRDVGICNDNFIVAWANSSSSSIWQGYYPNGTQWDGNCTVAGAAPSDTAAPNVTINFPLNFTYNSSIINFNITTVDDTGVNSCLYSLDAGITNITMANQTANEWNYTNLTMTQGAHTVNYYCNDTAGNLNGTVGNTFSLDSIQPAIQFVDPTPADGSTQTDTSITVNYTASDTNPFYSLLDVDNDILGWWDFEIDGSGNAVDKSSYGNDCNPNGNTAQTQFGKFGKSFNFPGASPDWLNCSNGGSLAFSSEDFSISAWINTTDSDAFQLVLFKGDFALGPTVKFGIYGTAFTPAVLLEDLDEIVELEANRTIVNNTWNHIVATKNSTNMVIYVNGLNSGNISVETVGSLVDSGDLGIGAHPDDTSWFNGNIDELIIFNRTLSNDEVQGLYNGTIFDNELTDLSTGAHTVTAYATDLAGNLNSTSRTIEVVERLNTSLRHIDFTLNETIFDSASYIQIANISFNLTQSSVLNIVKGVGQVRKFDNAASSTVSMRVTINDIELFDADVRTVSDLNDRGVFNVPLNSTVGNQGSNELIVEVKDSGPGSINLTKFELHLDTNITNDNTNVISDIQRVDNSFSSTSFVQIANFTFDKSSFNTSTMIDIVHRLIKTTGPSDTLPRCYLKNNVTDEVTPTYYRYLSGTSDVGSSGIAYRSKTKTSDIETWEMFCASDDTDTIDSNITFYAIEMGDDEANEVQGFQNESQFTGLTGSNNLLATATHTFRDSDQLEFAATIIMQSTSGAQEGDSSPMFFINSTEAPDTRCKALFQRSLSGNNDVGTAKIYADCVAEPSATSTSIAVYDSAVSQSFMVINEEIAFVDPPPPESYLPNTPADVTSDVAFDASDNNRESAIADVNQEAYHHFAVQINDTISEITMLNWTYESISSNSNADLLMYAWNVTASEWVLLQTVSDFSSEATYSNFLDTSTANLSNFINSTNFTTFLAYLDNQHSSAVSMNTDYFKLEVSTEEAASGATTNTFNLYTDVAAGETLDILNVSFLGYESTSINTTQGLVATSITIISPINNQSVSGNVTVEATVNDPSDLGWYSNVSLQFPNGTKALDIINEAGPLNSTQTSFNSSQVDDGPYQINWTIYNSFALAQSISNITIANTPQFIEDIQIWIEEILIANILDFTG